MRNDLHRHSADDVPKNGLGRGRGSGGNGFFSVRSLSNYVRIVSSGASNVASTVRSAGASIVSSISDRHDETSRDQVQWAGFDKLENEGGLLWQVLLLGYRSGFQVWDVEQADDVRQLASRHDGPVSFLQMQKKLIPSKKPEDKFADARPLLVVVGNGSITSGGDSPNGGESPRIGSTGPQDITSDNPTYLRFYSLRNHDYVHHLKFRATVFSVRCSSRVIVVCQATQIHCLDAATLERGYTVLTYPVVAASISSGGIGYGPVAIGTRWLAYSGNLIAFSSSGRVSPQQMSSGKGLLVQQSNGGLVTNFAKESSKQLAAGLVTLGDMGYKKLSKYYSEYLSDTSGLENHGNSSLKINSSMNGQLSETENAGMVIVRDIISKSVIVQFRAHSSPISALCFDPSGMLLVTASIHGHNINVYGIVPSSQGESAAPDTKGTYIHLYRLQRGITNAVIQDISFSNDSLWIMISSSRGTSHLYALSPSGTTAISPSNEDKFSSGFYGSDLMAEAPGLLPYGSSYPKHIHERLFTPGAPVTLSALSRIRNGSIGLKGAVNAAAAATGKVNPLYGAIASTFHNCKCSGSHSDIRPVRSTSYLLVFSPSGSIIQYVLRHRMGENSGSDVLGLSNASYRSTSQGSSRLDVEALKKWDVCHKRNRRDRGENVDIYGDHGNDQGSKLIQKGIKKGTSIYPDGSSVDMKAKLSGESHHTYISQVELHVYEPRTPLWEKSEICFQAMMDIKAYNNSYLGEIEVEKITSRIIETRSKDLAPVFDYVQTPILLQLRTSTPVFDRPVALQHKSGLESGRLSCKSSSNALDSIANNVAIAELPDGISDNCWNESTAEANEGFVRNTAINNNMRSQIQFVNSNENLKLETQFNPVDNTKNLKSRTPSEDYDNSIC